MIPVLGGCLCEKVRYKIHSFPISQGICYCRQCQKTGGACGSPLMVLQKDSFECSQTALSFYRTKSDRGSTVTRNFCKECGSHIFSQISGIPNILTVKAATLDDVDFFSPGYLVWTESAGPSCTFPSGVLSFPKGAPLEVVLASESIRKIYGIHEQ